MTPISICGTANGIYSGTCYGQINHAQIKNNENNQSNNHLLRADHFFSTF